MRKSQLKYVTTATLCFIAAAIIVLAGIRAWVTGEAPSTVGADLFQKKGCTQCHFTDSRKTKVGPGLKGLFNRGKLPESGRPVTIENVQRQLIDPYENMPVFKDKLTKAQQEAIIDYLKTL
jgi:cytochrome c551/c552